MSTEPNENETQTPTKEFYKSKTFWSLMVAIALTLFDIPLESVSVQMEQVIQVVSLIAALGGRMDAKSPMSIFGVTLPGSK